MAAEGPQAGAGGIHQHPVSPLGHVAGRLPGVAGLRLHDGRPEPRAGLAQAPPRPLAHVQRHDAPRVPHQRRHPGRLVPAPSAGVQDRLARPRVQQSHHQRRPLVHDLDVPLRDEGIVPKPPSLPDPQGLRQERAHLARHPGRGQVPGHGRRIRPEAVHHQHRRGGGLVRLEQRGGLRLPEAGEPAPDEPRRVGEPQGQPLRHVVRLRHREGVPALRQTPEEGICQAGPALVAAGPLRQGHRLADGSVGRDPVEEPELVGAHPEDLPEPDRQVGHPPPPHGLKPPVQRSPPAQDAVGQLREERRLLALQRPPREGRVQQDGGVGSVPLHPREEIHG